MTHVVGRDGGDDGRAGDARFEGQRKRRCSALSGVHEMEDSRSLSPGPLRDQRRVVESLRPSDGQVDDWP
eukprot:6191205-Pleurochrysis_carterae.AAC.1